MKTCNRCKGQYSLKEYGSNFCCKLCYRVYKEEQYLNKKLEAIQYLGGKCYRCGWAEHSAALDFHHCDTLEKEVSWDYLRNRTWNRIVQELDKCVLLCACCHRITHADGIKYEPNHK